MATKKALFYIKRLIDKGFSEEKVAKFCNVHPARFDKLKLPGTIPTRLEVHRLRNMLRLSPESTHKAAAAVWAEARAKSSDKAPEKPLESTEAPDVALTERQIETLGLLAEITTRGQRATVLDRTNASLSSRMQKHGLTFVEFDTAGKKTFRRYGLTEAGVLVARGLGFTCTFHPVVAQSPQEGQAHA